MGLGNYVRALLISVAAYTITFIGSGNVDIPSPPPGGLELITWFFTTLASLIGKALSVISFPMIPYPLNILLTLIFGSLFIYGVIGIGYYIVRTVKPFS